LFIIAINKTFSFFCIEKLVFKLIDFKQLVGECEMNTEKLINEFDFIENQKYEIFLSCQISEIFDNKQIKNKVI